MGLGEQQEQLGAVARRLADIAPSGWARLVGNWEAVVDDSGTVLLDSITTAVVHGGDRWLYGQIGHDQSLYDAVVRLNEQSAEAGPDHRWTTLDLRVDPDGELQVDLGYEPPKRSRGIRDEESYGRFERYLDIWVAQHGPVPPARDPSDDQPTPSREDPPVVVALDAEQRLVIEQIARSYAAAAPPGWVRVVAREETSVAPDTAGSVGVRVVIVETADGLEQQTFDAPSDVYFPTHDMLDELAAASPTQVVVLALEVDRDGSYQVAVTQDVPRVLVGIRDETSSKQVHKYLELHRDELTRLLR